MEWEAMLRIEDEWKNQVLLLDKNSSLEEWQDCLARLLTRRRGRHYLCNEKSSNDCAFPSGKWTFQHHCAYFNAPIEVVAEMVKEGFPMSYKDNEGKMPCDHVAAENSEEYKSLFQPKYRVSNLDVEKLGKIEHNFHEVIMSRCQELVEKHNLILPLLAVLLEGEELMDGETYCAIPGMYGGFSFFFMLNDDESNVEHLVTSSWCRVVGGSGQKHICYDNKWELVDEGFV